MDFKRTPRTDLLQNGLVRSPCSPRDSQESSPTPQLKSIRSSVLSFLHSPTFTSIVICPPLNHLNSALQLMASAPDKGPAQQENVSRFAFFLWLPPVPQSCCRGVMEIRLPGMCLASRPSGQESPPRLPAAKVSMPSSGGQTVSVAPFGKFAQEVTCLQDLLPGHDSCSVSFLDLWFGA